ncbi:hypothetical protein K239x_29110 [Planctomycetes bacterium K23_9]|uniref:Uncharacterized protein n=1 Tax=Stieleria marina TaxID=1930275 RepID=A0A517NUW1_9BACT|nr:hypothetical protein K239x_29110 [Planctomycetes bacterium K23_9]
MQWDKLPACHIHFDKLKTYPTFQRANQTSTPRQAEFSTKLVSSGNPKIQAPFSGTTNDTTTGQSTQTSNRILSQIAPPAGDAQPRKTPGKPEVCLGGGAIFGAVGSSAMEDSTLRTLVQSWSTLDQTTKENHRPVRSTIE